MQLDKPDILTVSQLTRRVKTLLETEISYVWVSGEVSNWRVSPSGHAYFTLKDADAQLDAVIFRGHLMKLRFAPENGLEVVVSGRITVYEKRGNYQIVCEEMQPKGYGALQLAFEKLKRKLEAEGLFDAAHKKPLPMLPRRIGVVTSPTGAAIRDILHVLGRRFANVHVLIYPARVQGEEAAEEIVEGIRVLEDLGVNVMIVGRGGGSLEDLWPFNEELVVRAIHEAQTPIISAVGHEIDFTLSDFAADLRAPTPSAAAEIVVQEREVLLDRVQRARSGMAKATATLVDSARSRLRLLAASYLFQRPEELVRQRRQQVDEFRMRLDSALHSDVDALRRRLDHANRALSLLSPSQRIARGRDALTAAHSRLLRAVRNEPERGRARFRMLAAKLHALSPLAILGRGYALVWKQPEGVLIRDVAQLERDDTVRLRFGKGEATATIQNTEGDSHGV